MDIRTGQLVLDPDGYYAIVLRPPVISRPLPDGTQEATVELFLSNGLRVTVHPDQVRPLGLKQGDGSGPPASFLEILSGRYQ